MSQLALHFFGTPRIERDGAPQSLPTRKGIALLAFLADHQQPISRNELATLFWPELDQQRARAALRRDLYRLNQALGEDWALIERDTVQLHPDVWVEVRTFQTGVNADDVASWETAVSLYRAPFLAGFSLSDSSEFDDWQQRKSAQLQQQMINTLDKLTTAYATTDNGDTAVTHAQHALTIDPLHETAHRHLMRLYLQQGKRQDALRQYHLLSERLQAELGVPPSAETEAVFAILTNPDPPIRLRQKEPMMKTAVTPNPSPPKKQPRWQLWAGIAILIVVALGLFINQRRQLARQTANSAYAKLLALEAVAQLPEDRDLALLLAVAAVQTDDNVATRHILYNIISSRPSHFVATISTESDVNAVAFSENGRYLATAHRSGQITLRETANWQPVIQWQAHDSTIHSLAFTANGDLLSTGQDKQLRRWSVPAGRLINSSLQAQAVTNLTTSVQGTAYGSGSDLMIDQTTIPTENLIATVMLSPTEGVAAVGHWDGTVTLWRPTSGSQVGDAISAHTDAVTAAVFSANGRFLITGGRDKQVHVWQDRERIASHDAHTHWVTALDISADGMWIASTGWDGQLLLWAWQTAVPQTLLPASDNSTTDVAFAPIGTQFVVSGADGVTLWDAAVAHPLQTPLREHDDSVIDVSFTPNGRLISGSVDGQLIVRDTETNLPENGQPIQLADVFAWAVALDGQTAVAARSNTITQYDTATNSPLKSPMTIGSTQITSIDLHINGQWVATGSVDGLVQVTNVETGAVLWQGRHDQQINDVSFSQDGQWLASASNDQTARIWVANTGGVTSEGFVHDTAVIRAAFTLQNQLITGGENGTVTLWLTPDQPEVIGKHDGAVTALAADTEERYIASGSWDSTILLWDLAGREDPPFQLNAHTRGIASLAFHAERQLLASASWDDTVIVWQLSSEAWQAAACAATTRTFTAGELVRFGLDTVEIPLCQTRDGVNTNAAK